MEEEGLPQEWIELINEIKNCKKCQLYKYRKKPVPGEGNINAEIMFVGEAPGAKEDETGRPFVGAAGKLLTKLLNDIGIKREDVYITNIVKCRPPGNRDPTDEEIKACIPYLFRQIELIKPRIIVALGRHAARVLLSEAGIKWTSMTRMHGKVFDVSIRGIRVKLFITYHPAAALYYPKLKPGLEHDFLELKKLLENKAEKHQRTILDYF